MDIIFWILAIIFAITIHEASHAYTANYLGDPTAKLMGRLSLNPIVHYDPVGTTMLIVLSIARALGFPIMPFGWAKPVEFDPFNLKNPRKDSALISLAGPLSNIIIAILSSIVIRLMLVFGYPIIFLFQFLYPLIVINLVLAIFNLIPIHPLDGGKIFIGILPQKEAEEADVFLHRYGMLIMFMLIFPSFAGSSPISMIIEPAVNFMLTILLPAIPLT